MGDDMTLVSMYISNRGVNPNAQRFRALLLSRKPQTVIAMKIVPGAAWHTIVTPPSSPRRRGPRLESAGVPARTLAPAKVAAIFILLCGLGEAMVIPAQAGIQVGHGACPTRAGRL